MYKQYNHDDIPEVPGIYAIINAVNGKLYVGQAKNLHVRAVLENHAHNKPLQDSYNKYGIDNHYVTILEYCELKDLDSREIHWISELHSFVRDPSCNGYNLTLGGGGTLGHTHSDEVKQRLSKAAKGNKVNLGRKLTPEHKEKIRQSCPKHHTLEHNKHVSEALKGRKPSDKTIAASVAWHKEHMRGNKFLEGRKTINNGEHEKKVLQDEIQSYLDLGWSLGVLPRRKVVCRRNVKMGDPTGTVWINNGISSKRVLPSIAETMLADGWVLGQLPRTYHCTCKICGEPFLGKGSNHLYCDKCKNN